MLPVIEPGKLRLAGVGQVCDGVGAVVHVYVAGRAGAHEHAGHVEGLAARVCQGHVHHPRQPISTV